MTNISILHDIKDGFDMIAQAVGKKKEDALRYIKENNANAWVALYYLLNPMMTYGFGERSYTKNIDMTPTMKFENVCEVMMYLNSLNGINDKTIANVKYYINNCDEYKDIALGLICKSIRLGITAKTVNKVSPGYIPIFSCQLANKYFDNPTIVEGKQFTITEKLDGIRCIAVVKRNSIKLFSRQGQIIEGLVDIEKDLAALRNERQPEFVLDGELLISNRDEVPSKEQYKQTIKIVRSDGEKHGITYNVFDYLLISAFETQVCTTPYRLRRAVLNNCVAGKTEHVYVVPAMYSGDDTNKIVECLNIQRAANHEGIMININTAVYDFKRTNNLLKVKVMQDCDLEIVDVEEGSGKYAGTTGSLIVDYKGNKLGVGSGLSDADRAMFWNNKEQLIGRVVTVQYFEETNNADGTLSLRFPVF